MSATVKNCVTRQSELFPEEPHYVPGYRGYCPQMAFKMGQTYGKTTHGILSDKTIAKSGRRVLAQTSTVGNTASSAGTENSREAGISKNRRAISFGDKKLTNDMVPGYTGYIPKREEHFGTRYAVGCHRAIYDFEQNRDSYGANLTNRLEVASRAPQQAVRSQPAPYVSVKQVQHSVSPYFMETSDPGKTFMSGYTGFIPCARAHFAMVYPVNCMTALTEFTGERTKMKKFENQPISSGNISGNRETDVGSSGGQTRASMHSIYRNKEGLLPRYTGYLPGHKYRYGVTFGTSARFYNVK